MRCQTAAHHFLFQTPRVIAVRCHFKYLRNHHSHGRTCSLTPLCLSCAALCPSHHLPARTETPGTQKNKKKITACSNISHIRGICWQWVLISLSINLNKQWVNKATHLFWILHGWTRNPYSLLWQFAFVYICWCFGNGLHLCMGCFLLVLKEVRKDIYNR